MISVNEHNGGPSAYFKNVLDWLSRLDRSYLENTKVFLMSTSPGKRGAISAHEYIMKALQRVSGEVVATFSLPSFHTNFNEKKGILEADLKKEHLRALEKFKSEL